MTDMIFYTNCPSCTWRDEIKLTNGICPQCGVNWHILQVTDELATLRAQLAEARELISEAKIEIGFAIYGNTQPSISAYDKLTAYLQKVKSA